MTMSADERIKRDPNSNPRADRSSEDRRVTENRTVTDPVALAAMVQAMGGDILPQPPEIAGYHMIWLSTTNSQDPIYKRERVGYTPVKPEEIPEFGHMKITSGQHEGCIGFNEMVLYKIDLDKYYSLMRAFHHDMPLNSEERFDDVTEMRDGRGRVIGMVEGDGLANRGTAPEPIFE
jgi:hypothetical protein